MTPSAPNEPPVNPDYADQRAEHLAWSKQRALEYVDLGQLETALTSFFSDMSKSPLTAKNEAIGLGTRLMVDSALPLQCASISKA
ncbi:hypothetical protein [Amycolatopsis sp. NPDC004079]|uniref:hypothetical protein n=1 Tax=Amycolatopsis sp. NPDC004079 TaxID=3154549 RepID=UPI00339ED119